MFFLDEMEGKDEVVLSMCLNPLRIVLFAFELQQHLQTAELSGINEKVLLYGGFL